ncbi:MAG: AAA family ATPase [Planctomycetota bacterium]|nr:AAA family ATPase [Planctomycetota bacterium]
MIHCFGDGFELDETLFELLREGQVVALEPKVFDVLRHLVASRDQVLSKDELFQRVWPGEYVTESVLHRCIHLARKAIGDGEHKRLLTTVRGRGYRFVGTVSTRDATTPPEPGQPADSTPPADLFLGREAVMAEMRTAFAEAAEGAGRVVLLVGDPGIGKTRVIEESIRELRESGVFVSMGRCLEEEGSPAFWPWIQVLRGLGGGDPRASELLERMEGAAVQEETDESALRQRFRLFDDFARLLAFRTREQPWVLVIDDLHWADLPSLLLFEHLAAACREQRVLLVAALRDERKERDHPFARTRGEVARLGHCRPIAIGGLDRDQVARFLELALGRSVPDNLIDAVFERTEGNPLFLREVARWILSQPQASLAEFVAEWNLELPDGLRDVNERRIAALGLEAARTLEVAAVVGREFEFHVLEALLDGSANNVHTALSGALAARVIEEVAGQRGRYAFSHALVRETLLDSLPHGVRVTLHARLGEILEKNHMAHPEAVLDELARHFFEAFPLGGEERAIRYAELAAEAASQRLAHEEAAVHLERAVSMLERSSTPEIERRLALQKALAETWSTVGNIQKLRAAFTRAAETARILGDDRAYAEAVLGAMGSPEWGPVDREPGDAALAQAFRVLPEEPSTLRIRLLARQAAHVLHWEEHQKALRLSDEALAMAKAYGDRDCLTVALAVRILTRRIQLFEPGVIDELERTIDAVSEAVGGKGHPLPDLGDLRSFLIDQRIDLAMLRGDGPGVRQGMEEIDSLVSGSSFSMDRWLVLQHQIALALLEGRPEEAEAALYEGFRLGQRVHLPWTAVAFLGGALALGRHRGDHDKLGNAARSFHAGISVTSPSISPRKSFSRAVEVFDASLLADAGRLKEARQELESWSREGLHTVHTGTFMLVGLCELAHTAFVLKESAIAEQLEEKLAPFGSLHRQISGAHIYLGPVATCRAELARTLGRRSAAQGHYEQAIEAARGMRAPPHVAWAQAGLAQLLAEGGSDSERRQALDLARSACERGQALGMRALVDEMEALGAALGG